MRIANPEYDDDDEEVEEDGEEGEADDSSDAGTLSRSPEPVASSLNAAIKDAPVSQLREVLTYICDHNDFARKYADSCLLTPISGNGEAADNGRKRKRFEKCKNCSMEFSVLANEKGDCVFHPGKCHVHKYNNFMREMID